jgi:hypothetical protein
VGIEGRILGDELLVPLDTARRRRCHRPDSCRSARMLQPEPSPPGRIRPRR